MNKVLHLTVFLAAVSAIAGGALAYANEVTAPIIAKNKENAEKAVLMEMYPKASLDDFKVVDYTGDDKEITKVYEYGDLYIFNMTVPGYDQGTTFLVAINSKDGKIAKYQAISNGDTKGIGSKVTEEPFAKSLEGKDAAGKLDTISGATYSSTPIVEGINKAAEIVPDLK